MITVARLVPEKGVDVLLNAVTQMGSVPPLVIVGDADHDDEYSNNLKRSAGESVKFLGKLPHAETLSLVQSAAAFVLPSFHEGLPIVLLEALALGTPVVASDIIANKEILGDSKFGYLFKTGDPGDLRQVIESVLSLDSAERQELADRGRQLVRDKYDWDRVSDRFAEIAKELFPANEDRTH